MADSSTHGEDQRVHKQQRPTLSDRRKSLMSLVELIGIEPTTS